MQAYNNSRTGIISFLLSIGSVIAIILAMYFAKNLIPGYLLDYSTMRSYLIMASFGMALGALWLSEGKTNKSYFDRISIIIVCALFISLAALILGSLLMPKGETAPHD